MKNILLLIVCLIGVGSFSMDSYATDNTNEKVTTVSINFYRTREPNKLPGNIGNINSLNPNSSLNTDKANTSGNSLKIFPKTGDILNQTMAVIGLFLVLSVCSTVLLIKRKET